MFYHDNQKQLDENGHNRKRLSVSTKPKLMSNRHLSKILKCS
uniref:Uncharacterized protein n=1 Tax=Setaria italica TaxID=4555 RepID=K3XUL3_SETIT